MYHPEYDKTTLEIWDEERTARQQMLKQFAGDMHVLAARRESELSGETRKSDAEYDAQDYDEVSHWRDENGELLDEDGRQQAAAGLKAARQRFTETYGPDVARWEQEGGHLIRDDEPEPVPKPPAPAEIGRRVTRQQEMDKRMMEITEKLLKGEDNA